MDVGFASSPSLYSDLEGASKFLLETNSGRNANVTLDQKSLETNC